MRGEPCRSRVPGGCLLTDSLGFQKDASSQETAVISNQSVLRHRRGSVQVSRLYQRGASLSAAGKSFAAREDSVVPMTVARDVGHGVCVHFHTTFTFTACVHVCICVHMSEDNSGGLSLFSPVWALGWSSGWQPWQQTPVLLAHPPFFFSFRCWTTRNT